MKKILCAVFAAIMLALFPHSISAKQDGKVLKLDFKQSIVDTRSSGLDLSALLTGGSGEQQMTLMTYVKAIDAASQDPEISGIYMTPQDLSMNMASSEEIRAALKRFRKAGKPIVSYNNSFGNMSYYMASVADKVIVNPMSENFVIGLSTMQYFLKDILDTLGIDVQLIRHGKYKSAGEMFIRNDISPENRAQYEELFSSIWTDWSEDIAADRGFSVDDFNGWIDNLELVNAQDYKDRGLVDEIWHKSQVEDYLCETLDVKSIEQAQFVTIGKYASKLKKGNRFRKIAVIYANGEIVMKGSSSDIVGEKMANTLKKVREDSSISGVVFRVNSPGGSVEASEIIRQEVNKLAEEKPVVVSYGDYAASGGYWISAGAGTIFTDRTTLTGSIGCFSMIPSLGNAVKKNLHINLVTLGTNEHSDMVQGVNRLSAEEEAFFQASIEEIYDTFTGIVADGRHLDKDYVDSIAQGRVWSGSDAIEIGLADHIGGLTDAISFLADSLGFKSYRIKQYPETKELNLMALLMGKDIEDPDETLTTSTSIVRMIDLEKVFPFAATVRNLDRPTTFARLPFVLMIK